MMFFNPSDEYKPTAAEIWLGNHLKAAFEKALAAAGVHPVWTMLAPLKDAIDGDDAARVAEILKKCPKAARGELNAYPEEPLRYALQNEKYAAATAMIAQDKSLLLDRDYFGRQPLADLAGPVTGEDEKTKRVLTFLMDAGAPLDDEDREGSTALGEAISRESPAVAEFLLDHGVRIDPRDKYQQTPMINAAACGRDQMVRMLIDRGAEINAQSEHGITPATSAVLSHYFDLALAIMQRGGKVNFGIERLDEAIKDAKEEKNHAFLSALRQQRDAWEEDRRAATTEKAVQVIEDGLDAPVQVHAIHLKKKAAGRPKS